MKPEHRIAECPVWPPAGLPKKLQTELAKFTRNGSGLVRWYAGKTRFVCGKNTPLVDVPRVWEDLVDAIKLELRQRVPTGHPTVRQCASKYFEFIDYRVANGQPEPLAAITAEDYKRIITRFGRTRIPGTGSTLADTTVDELGPDQFRAYVLQFSDAAPATLGRAVAAIRTFFSYCEEERLIARVPHYGRYFHRPEQQKYRDRRLAQKKSFRAEEIWALAERATPEERAWLGLGLSGALDNSDIAHLTFSTLDKKQRLIDFRRRKTGKIARLIPIHPVAWGWLGDYLKGRPEPADPVNEDLIFLTPTGLPLQRVKQGRKGIGNNLDYLAMCWTRLMRHAGLRPKAGRKMMCATCGIERAARRQPCRKCGTSVWRKSVPMSLPDGGDRRGFRSLRTTFPNFAPRGYRDEVELIMGHATGSILLEHYLEEHGLEPLVELVDHIWKKAFTWPLLPDGGVVRPDPLPYGGVALGEDP